MRKQAEELWKKASPEQREQIKELAKQMAERQKNQRAGQRGAGGSEPGDGPMQAGRREPGSADRQGTNFVDSNLADSRADSAGPQRVVAEWLGQGKPGAGVAAAERERIVREAVKSGEKAIEERAAPKRFDRMLMDYFRRLPEQVAPAAPPAPDAKPTP